MFFVLALFMIFFGFKDLSKSEVNAAAVNEAATSQFLVTIDPSTLWTMGICVTFIAV